jgi:CxxC motif-containing protein
MKEINKITIDRKVKIGEIVAKNLCGSDINLIATFPLD